MRGGDLRKPRKDLHARLAEEAERQQVRNQEVAVERAALNAAALALIEEGVRTYLSNKKLSSGFLILLLDKVRLVFREMRIEQGVDDDRLDKPFDWGKAGRNPRNYEEGMALSRYLKGDGPRPTFWFGPCDGVIPQTEGD